MLVEGPPLAGSWQLAAGHHTGYHYMAVDLWSVASVNMFGDQFLEDARKVALVANEVRGFDLV